MLQGQLVGNFITISVDVIMKKTFAPLHRVVDVTVACISNHL